MARPVHSGAEKPRPGPGQGRAEQSRSEQNHVTISLYLSLEHGRAWSARCKADRKQFSQDTIQGTRANSSRGSLLCFTAHSSSLPSLPPSAPLASSEDRPWGADDNNSSFEVCIAFRLLLPSEPQPGLGSTIYLIEDGISFLEPVSSPSTDLLLEFSAEHQSSSSRNTCERPRIKTPRHKVEQRS